MPIALDTNEVFAYVFSTDRNKPESDQPALLFRYAACRQTRQIAELFDASDDAKTPGESFDKSLEAVRVLLCGWRNFPIPYDPVQLDTIVSDTDLSELRARLLQDMGTSELKKKGAAFASETAAKTTATP